MNQFTILLIFIVIHESAQFPGTKQNDDAGKKGGTENDIALACQKTSPQQPSFTQKLDHFNPSDNRVWQQRYWKSEEFYKAQGPIFVWISGGEEADTSWLIAGQWIQYATEFGALLYVLEHRFYGESKPTKDTSLENLVYLNSEQAVEDVAEFIKGIKAKDTSLSQAKVILFGGSYGGALAAWARLKHPELIFGAVSSSAILLAIVDFAGYYRNAQSTLAAYNEQCPKAIQTAFEAIRESLKTDAGRKSLTQMFSLCPELPNTQVDFTNFLLDTAVHVATIVQYNKDNVALSTKSITIEVMCNILIRKNVHPLVSYAEFQKMILRAQGTSCVDPTYQKAVDDKRKIDYESAAASGRLARYTACTEFGYLPSSSQSTDLFGASFFFDFWTQNCQDVFGTKFDRKFMEDGVARTNQNFGGLEINVDNVIFVYGSDDPWHTLGITKAQSGKLYDVVEIKGGAHCSDIYEPTSYDSAELKAARETIFNILRSWISNK